MLEECRLQPGTYTTAMFLKAGVACCLVVAAALSAEERGRVERSAALAGERLAQWLGDTSATADAGSLRLRRAVWSLPPSMDLESQVVFAVARARFSAIAESPATTPLVDGIAWHLQSRIVEELFDLAHQRPGHHTIAVPVFGESVSWTIPSLTVSRRARDSRVSPAIARAADAVATLENVVGWPALAAALRALAATRGPIDLPGVQASLAASLGVPVGWFFAALAPDFHVNYSLGAVASEAATCGLEPCVRTTIDVVRDGAVLFPNQALAGTSQIELRLDFDHDQAATFWWSGRQSERLTIESATAPVAVRLDPNRVIVVDSDRLDQEWHAAPRPAPRPTKALAAWLVWLQDAVMTYTTLL